MQLTTHLSFRGQCEEAFKCYERLLGGRIDMMLTYGDSPMALQVPPEWRSKILHATLAVSQSILTGTDVLIEQYEKPQGFSVLLGIAEPEEAERLFHVLAEKGSIRMPYQKTFWSSGFGVLVDRFGIPWEINCEHSP
ncbi:MAG: VOC family protein [Gammaproteobacteria bacterium]|jgi:PhnB protein|nr:MAG: VOC family protein [Gammaproteobacteria bacterium]